MMALMKTTGYPELHRYHCRWVRVFNRVSNCNVGWLKWIDRILPPIVVGPIVVVIGLSLAGTAAKDATINSATGHYDLRFLRSQCLRWQ